MLSEHSLKARVYDGIGRCINVHGMSDLHICEGPINAERYLQVLDQHMLPSRQRLFQGLFQEDNAETHSDHITAACNMW